MEIKYRPDTVDEILEEICALEECVGDMKANLKIIKDTITSSSSGKTISKIEQLMEKKIDEFTEVEEDIGNFYEYISNYIEGLKEIDEVSILSKDYYIDTKEVIDYIKDIIKILDNNEYNKLSRNFENSLEGFYTKRIEYNNVECSINIEADYENDEEAKQYIRKRQSKIDEQIREQFHNDGVLDEIKKLLKEFKD